MTEDGGFLVPQYTYKQLPSPDIRARAWRRLAFTLLHISRRIELASIWCDTKGHYSERRLFAGPFLQMLKDTRRKEELRLLKK